MRFFIGVLMVALLAGCDREEPSTEPASPLPHQPAPPAASDVAPSVSEPLSVEPQVEQGEPPDIEIESVAEPEAPTEPKLTVKVSPPSPRKARTPPSEETLPAPELDLSLPEDWLETLEEAEPTESALLPPLFAVPESEPAVHVSGRLIPWVEKDETVIDGAQLDFEFRR